MPFILWALSILHRSSDLVNSEGRLSYMHPMSSWRLLDGIFVCDGGDDFWGLEYDPESKAFSALEFNGDA
jgi:hypothetical protein